MNAYLKHINQFNPTYNAIVSRVSDDILLEEAKEADAALAKGDYWGWMHGMPHAIKDLAPVKGMLHTSGSPMFANRIAEEDSVLVQKIRNQGALFIGKTNTPEFGLGSQPTILYLELLEVHTIQNSPLAEAVEVLLVVWVRICFLQQKEEI